MKFQDKYRIESNRLPNWDYSGNGIYFLTLCVQDRVCVFGDIVDGHMNLNQFGKIAQSEWLQSANIRSEIKLDEFVVMPNHLHGIVIIDNNNTNDDTRDLVETHGRASLRPNDEVNHQNIGTMTQYVETHGRVSLQPPERALQSIFQRKPKSISSFVAGYKSSVTTKINEILIQENKPIYNRVNRLWQPNYFDRIVRDQNELGKIINYILSNPENWINDQQNQEGLWQ